jgi:tetratricopeptide (TPR) repeat protein
MNPKPTLDGARASLLRRAHAEAHDVYVPAESAVDPALKEECAALFRALRFDEGVARAQRDAGWERDADAVLYVGLGRHYQRRYDEARAAYGAAMALSADASFRATCAANAASAHYEEGALDGAREGYAHALSIDPLNEFALLGLIAVDGQRRDADAVVRDAATLRARWPEWRSRPVIVGVLRSDRSYRFVRDEPGLFERAFGVPLEALDGG